MMFIRLFLLSIFVLTLAGCQIDLNTNLNEQEANEMMAKLLSENIAVTKVAGKDGVTLKVARRNFGDAVDVLASHGLPRRSYSTIGEVFADDGLVASPMQEWARYNFAKSQEISQSLSSMPGVVNADVHIASSRKESPFDETEPPSASVIIKIQKASITPELVPQIKQMVAYSIPDIDYGRVSVIVAPVKEMTASSMANTQRETIMGIVVSASDASRIRNVVSMVGIGLAVLLSAAIGAFFLLRFRKGKGKTEAVT